MKNVDIKIEKINPKFIQIYTMFLNIIAFITFEIGYCNCEYFNNIINNTASNSSYNFSMCRIVAYFGMILLYFIFRKDFVIKAVETSKNRYKRTFIYFAITYLIFIIFLIVFGILSRHEITRGMSIWLLTAITANLFILYVCNDYIKNIVITIFTFGIIFSITTDFNHVADERKHFITAFNIAFLNFDYTNNPITDEQVTEVPDLSDYTKIDKFLRGNYKPNIIKKTDNDNIYTTPTVYSPILYVPSAIGIACATFLGGSVIDIYIYGRIFNLMFYCFLACIGLKLLPFKKNIFTAVILMPLLILYAGSFSIDAACVGLVSIFIAYCLKLYKECETINLKQILKLLILFILMLLAKNMAYVMVCLIALILPIKNTLKKNKKAIPLIIAILIIIIVIGTILIIHIINSQLKTDPRGLQNSNSGEQIKFMLQNPFSCIELAINHIKDTLLNFNWISELHHHAFFTINAKYLALPMLLFILYVSLTEDDINFKLKEKIILLLTFMGAFVTTSLPLYITYTTVGILHVAGYQARYIFPILPLVLMCISNNKVKSIEHTNRVMNVAITSGLFVMFGLIQLTI